MQNKGYITAMESWLRTNRPNLDEHQIRVTVHGPTQEFSPNSIHVDLRAEECEATVQLWENGLSDIHFLDWVAASQDPAVQVEVTHHELQNTTELFAVLSHLLERMFQVQEPRAIYSDTVALNHGGGTEPAALTERGTTR